LLSTFTCSFGQDARLLKKVLWAVLFITFAFSSFAGFTFLTKEEKSLPKKIQEKIILLIDEDTPVAVRIQSAENLISVSRRYPVVMERMAEILASSDSPSGLLESIGKSILQKNRMYWIPQLDIPSYTLEGLAKRILNGSLNNESAHAGMELLLKVTGITEILSEKLGSKFSNGEFIAKFPPGTKVRETLEKLILHVEPPKPFPYTEAIHAEVKALALEILEDCKPPKCVVIGIGRSPTSITNYLQETVPGSAIDLPLSNFYYNQNPNPDLSMYGGDLKRKFKKMRPMSKEKKARFFAHFRSYVEGHLPEGVERVKLLDYSGTRFGSFGAVSYIEDFLEESLGRKVPVTPTVLTSWQSVHHAQRAARFFGVKPEIIELDQYGKSELFDAIIYRDHYQDISAHGRFDLEIDRHGKPSSPGSGRRAFLEAFEEQEHIRPFYRAKIPFISEIGSFKQGLLMREDVRALLSQTEKPEYLFHWVRAGEGRAFASENQVPIRNGKVTLPPKNNAIFSSFQRSGKKSLYLTSHPAGGMAVNDAENYAQVVNGRSAQLVAMKPKPNATFGLYVSDENGWVTPKTQLAPETDFVLHIRIERGRINWMEWVLQNPEAVEWASAKPSKVGPVVRGMLEGFDPETASASLFHNPSERYVPDNYRALLAPYLETNPVKQCLYPILRLVNRLR